MARLAHTEVWSDYVGAGGTRLARIAASDWESLTTTRRLTRDDTLDGALPQEASGASEIVTPRVLRLVFDDASWTEYRVRRVVATGTGGDGRLRVSGTGPLTELSGTLLTTTAGTVVTKGATITGAVSAIVDTILAGAPSWWSRGTVPGLTAECTGDTALAALRDLVAQLSYELDVRANGTSGYYVDVVAAIGASATSPDFRTGKNLLSATRIGGDDEATVVFPTCRDGTTIAKARWQVASLTGSVVELRDVYTQATPVAFDDQYVGLYLANDENPVAYTQITDSDASDGTVTVSSTAGIAVGDLVRIVASNTGIDVVSLTSGLSPARVVALDTRCESYVNHAPNPLLSEWSGGLPVRWTAYTAAGASPTAVEETSTVEYGTSSLRWTRSQVLTDNGFYSSTAPPFWKGTFRVRLRVRVWTSATAAVTLALVNSAGALLGGAGFTATSVSSNVTGWATLSLDCGTNTTPLTTEGLGIRVTINTSPATDIILDAAMMTVDQALPTNWTVGSGLCNAWVAGNQHLLDRAPPANRYEFTVADLQAIDPDGYPYDALALGATATVRDTVLDVTTQQRIVELHDDWRNPGRSRIALARVAPTITSTLVQRAA